SSIAMMNTPASMLGGPGIVRPASASTGTPSARPNKKSRQPPPLLRSSLTSVLRSPRQPCGAALRSLGRAALVLSGRQDQRGHSAGLALFVDRHVGHELVHAAIAPPGLSVLDLHLHLDLERRPQRRVHPLGENDDVADLDRREE